MMNRSTILAMMSAALLATPVALQAQQPGVTYRELADLGTSQLSLSGNSMSHSGHFVVLRSPQGLQVLDVRSGQHRKLGVKGRGVQWSPSDDFIVFEKAPADGKGWQAWKLAMDPRSGTPTGPARRLSLHGGQGGPESSPDGRSIVYIRQYGDSSGIIVTPSAGGPERVLYRERGRIGHALFSPDGRWIYFIHRPPTQISPGHGTPAQIRRIPAAGGKARTIIPSLVTWGGMSRDGRYLAYFPKAVPWSVDHAVMIIADPEGHTVARIRAVPDSYNHYWGNGHTLIYEQLDVPMGIHAFDLQTGAIRTLVPYGEGHGAATYSPDGRFLAEWQRVGDKTALALIPSGGGEPRSLPLRNPPKTFVWTPPKWSPDGSKIAFDTGGSGKIDVVNLASGNERVLATTDLRPGLFVWRHDGGAILYIASRPSGGWPVNAAVHEVMLDGRDREVRKLVASRANYAFAGDSAVVAYTQGLLRVFNLDGGERVLARPSLSDPWEGGFGVSPDGRWVAYATRESSAPNSRAVVTIVPLSGGEPRTLAFGQSGGMDLSWHPDSKHILVEGYDTPSSQGESLYLLPINGDAPRKLTANDPSIDFDAWSFSPDGRTLAVEAEQSWHWKLMEVDLDGVLAAAARKGQH